MARPLRLAALILAAALAGGPVAASEVVDKTAAELRDVLASDDANRIAKAFVDRYLAMAADLGSSSPEILEAAETFGRMLMEAKQPEIAVPFRERALVLRRRAAPQAVETALAAHAYAVTLFQAGREPEIEPLLAEAFAIWRGLGTGGAEAVESGMYLGRRRAAGARYAEAADLFAAAIRLGVGQRGRAAALRLETVDAAEAALTGPDRWDLPEARAARAAVLDAYEDDGARRALAYQRKRLAETRPDGDRRPDIQAQARIGEILARWMPDDFAARRMSARERARLLYLAKDIEGTDAAYVEAIGHAEALVGPMGLDVADLLMDAGESLSFVSSAPHHQERAAAHFERAMAIREARLAPTDRRIAIAAMRLAFVYHVYGFDGRRDKAPEAERLLQRARTILEADADADAQILSDVYVQLGQIAWSAGRNAEAVEHARAAVRQADRTDDPSLRLMTRGQLFSVLPPEAAAEEERLLDEQIAIGETIVERSPRWLLGALAARAQYDLALGRYAAADRAVRRAAAIGLAPDDRQSVSTLEILARIARFFGRNQDAADLYERAADLVETQAQNTPDILRGLKYRAHAASRREDYAAARDHLAKAADLQARVFGPDDPSNAEILTLHGIALWNLGDLAAAEPLLREALRLEALSTDPDRSTLAAKRADLGRLLTALGRPAEAVEQFAEAARHYGTEAANPPTRAQVGALHADALVAAGRTAEALAAARAAAAIITARIAGTGDEPSAASVRDAEVKRSSAIFVSQVRAAWAASRP